MSVQLKIALAESSAIIRNGLKVMLKQLPGFQLVFIEIQSVDSLYHTLRMHKPEVLIINPAIPGQYSMQHLKEESGCPELTCIALLYHVTDNQTIRLYDDQIGIFDTLEEIKQKFDNLFMKTAEPKEEEDDGQQTLSVREKEIVVCVVKGMTNREIADKLFLSTHTVITHRRNIARKLQIHSPSGLTIYAIVNKLIELEDIQHVGEK